MADEYIRKESVIDVARKYFGMIGLNPEILVDSFITMPPADVVPICQTGCKGCERENNLVVGSCSLCARFYKDMYEGVD